MPSDFSIQNLDELLTLDEAAKVWRMTPSELSEKSKGRNPAIPGIWLNKRVVRFHPRAMFAHCAHNSGVKPEIIAAMFNLQLSTPEAKQ
jgi:hypothetical protein